MSYLSVPRLHFAGKFISDIGYINNTCENYELGHSIPSRIDVSSTNDWKFTDCHVTRVCYADGEVYDSKGDDPFVTAPVAGTDDPVPGKLVDLDPQQQGVSQIWGFQLRVGPSGDSVVGDFAVTGFYDMWVRCPQLSGDTGASAYYQSVLNDLQWDVDSRFLSELRSASPEALSIKFMVDRFVDFPAGRVVGTIGPAAPHEPKHIVAGRRLQQATGQSRLYTAFCEVDADRGVLTLDMGNSVPANKNGGPPEHLGELTLVIKPKGGGDVVPLGQIDYSNYEGTALIQEFPVGDHLDLLGDNPLAVQQIPPSNVPGFAKTIATSPRFGLEEDPDGWYLRADQFVFRMNPEDPATNTASVDLYLRKYGQPARGEMIELVDISSSRNSPLYWGAEFGQNGRPIPTSVPETGTPPDALQYPNEVGPTDASGRVGRTDANGKFTSTVKLHASDPGYPRKKFAIDGQVYAVGYHLPGQPIQDWLSVLVHTLCQYSGTPTWTANVGPIFKQYAQLYPAMASILATYEDVTNPSNAKAIQQRLALPMSSAAYMPVVRDLSTSKLKMIQHWFDAGMPR